MHIACPGTKEESVLAFFDACSTLQLRFPNRSVLSLVPCSRGHRTENDFKLLKLSMTDEPDAGQGPSPEAKGLPMTACLHMAPLGELQDWTVRDWAGERLSTLMDALLSTVPARASPSRLQPGDNLNYVIFTLIFTVNE